MIPTYAFPVYYVSGGHIWPHLDVAENEISLTMQLELTPSGERGKCACVCGSDVGGRKSVAGSCNDVVCCVTLSWRAEAEWPLLLEDPGTKELKGVSMYDNDGVLYRGTEVVHWRDKMPDEYQVRGCVLV